MQASWRSRPLSLSMLFVAMLFTATLFIATPFTATLATVAQDKIPAAAPCGHGRDRTLSIVTLNLWHDRGDWPARERLIVDALRKLQPDLIALQEVIEHDAGRTWPHAQPATTDLRLAIAYELRLLAGFNTAGSGPQDAMRFSHRRSSSDAAPRRTTVHGPWS